MNSQRSSQAAPELGIGLIYTGKSLASVEQGVRLKSEDELLGSNVSRKRSDSLPDVCLCVCMCVYMYCHFGVLKHPFVGCKHSETEK